MKKALQVMRNTGVAICLGGLFVGAGMAVVQKDEFDRKAEKLGDEIITGVRKMIGSDTTQQKPKPASPEVK